MLPPLSRLMLVDGASGEHLAASQEAPRITTTLLVRVGAVVALIGKYSSVSLLHAPLALHRSTRAMWDRRREAPGTITRIEGAWPASARTFQLHSHGARAQAGTGATEDVAVGIRTPSHPC